MVNDIEEDFEDKEPCPHNDITMWITELHKRGYSREKKGEVMDLVYDKCKEDDLFSADVTCDNCGKSLEIEETRKLLLGSD